MEHGEGVRRSHALVSLPTPHRRLLNLRAPLALTPSRHRRSSYTLPFYERASLLSTHNFVLVAHERDSDTMLLCGKRAVEPDGAGVYSLDFGPAFSCLEAFGVALAAFKHRTSLT